MLIMICLEPPSSDNEVGIIPTNKSVEEMKKTMRKLRDFNNYSQITNCKIFIEGSICREYSSRVTM